MLTAAGLEPSVAALLARHGLTGSAEEPFEHDGWSGAGLTLLRRGRERFVLKRDSLARDWIARATLDVGLREAWVAAAAPTLGDRLVAPHLGAARDGDGVALLMPDLSDRLFAWGRPIGAATLERVLRALVAFHAEPPALELPWCPLRERLLLLSRPAAERYAAAGLPVGVRFLAGWDAFDRQASAPARAIVARLAADPSPLIAALGGRPATILHGDLKLANVGFLSDGRLAAIDWQMVLRAPVSVELGWFLVSNAADLPVRPAEVLAAYAAMAGLEAGEWQIDEDLAVLVGLLLRGWRKGLDAEAGVVFPSGDTALDDLAWWAARAAAAAERRLS